LIDHSAHTAHCSLLRRTQRYGAPGLDKFNFEMSAYWEAELSRHIPSAVTSNFSSVLFCRNPSDSVIKCG